MSRTETRLVDHLREIFVEPMAITRRERDRWGTDDYTEEFIRAVMLLGKNQTPKVSGAREGAKPVREPQEERPPIRFFSSAIEPDRVQLRERNGIWEIRVDGVFRGDYHRKKDALAEVARAKLSLR